MSNEHAVSRRNFFGAAAALGVLGLPESAAWTRDVLLLPPREQQGQGDEYDAMAKLANNENPYGPPESVMKAMTNAFKYANRYGYPDGGITQAIAQHHGVKPENILLAAGSGEILDVVGTTFLQGGKKVVGSEPSYTQVYQHATSIRADAFRIPLLSDYRQDIPAMIKAARTHYRDVGFV